jgi:2-polyprenyl-3-methyl-5-hydroxy-6-metoxy-1,4-benzoquinol methylase
MINSENKSREANQYRNQVVASIERMILEITNLRSELNKARSDLDQARSERDNARIERDQGRLIVDALRANNFAGHYYDWRLKRLRAIISHYGPEWFAGKTILELACGYGDIGAVLMMLGADVTFSDARKEHLDEIRLRYPSIDKKRLKILDLELGIKSESAKYDMVIHMGLLYHLDNWREGIIDCRRLANHLVLETEVCDALADDFEIKSPEDSPDHAFGKISTRPSEYFVEKMLASSGYDYSKITDDRCNSNMHVYDWINKNSLTWKVGQRRFWFCKILQDPK